MTRIDPHVPSRTTIRVILAGGVQPARQQRVAHALEAMPSTDAAVRAVEPDDPPSGVGEVVEAIDIAGALFRVLTVVLAVVLHDYPVVG